MVAATTGALARVITRRPVLAAALALFAASKAQATMPRGTSDTTDRGGDQHVLAACIDICVRATVLMDHGDALALAELFTSDLEFIRPSTYPDVAVRGRAELLAGMAARSSSDSVSRHVASNFVATRVAHDVVAVQSYFTHFRGNRTAAAPVPLADTLRSVGEYHDRLVFQDGRWRIARREARFIFGGL